MLFMYNLDSGLNQIQCEHVKSILATGRFTLITPHGSEDKVCDPFIPVVFKYYTREDIFQYPVFT